MALALEVGQTAGLVCVESAVAPDLLVVGARVAFLSTPTVAESCKECVETNTDCSSRTGLGCKSAAHGSMQIHCVPYAGDRQKSVACP